MNSERPSPAHKYAARIYATVQPWGESEPAGGQWVEFSGGDLPEPVMLRIHSTPDGRPVVTGLLLGHPVHAHEITSQTLRQIKLREILADLFQDYDPDTPPEWLTFEAMARELVVDSATRGDVAQTQPRGPEDEKLQAFARTYLTEMARQPQRAMSAAAKAHNVSRATANRWAEACRARGYLPPKSPPPNTTE